MARNRPVLAGTDFSTSSRTSVWRAARLADDLGAPLVLVNVVGDVPQGAPELLPAAWSGTQRRGSSARSGAMKSATALARTRLAEEGGPRTRARRLVRVGSPHRVLIDTAKEVDARAVVVGVHAARKPVEAMLLGTTAERVLRNGSVPVLLARQKRPASYRRGLVALDLGEGSARLVLVARDLCPDAALVLLHCVPPGGAAATKVAVHRAKEELAELASQLRLAPEAHAIDVRPIEPRKGILRAAADYDADLLVLGTHARRGPERWILGSVAEYVLRAARNDVLAIPPR